jgi:catechol 2,3-dioxygenase-like lactoylglutathione lyase family enzyme
MKITEIAFVCYAVTDIARARKFYEGVLGLEPTTITGNQWVEYAWGPYALAIGSSPQWKPSPDGCSAALEVEDFDAAVKKLRDDNVKFRMEPYDGPVCKMVAVFDPDGNTVVIHKRKGL